MSPDLEDLKKDHDRQLAELSRQYAHSLMDMDAAFDVLAKETDARFKSLEVRVAKLESPDGG